MGGVQGVSSPSPPRPHPPEPSSKVTYRSMYLSPGGQCVSVLLVKWLLMLLHI